MKVGQLLDSIQKLDLVLPEFQREYVWTKEQAKQLMISLTRGYPVGGLLIWKTNTPPELKNIKDLPERLGTVQVLLDGQQRLTTLHMLMTGEIPAFYNDTEIMNDPRELYYNLEEDEFQYYQASRMKDDPLWYRVVDCFTDQSINVFEVASEKGLEGQEAFDLTKTLNENLNRLKAIRDTDLPEQIVPSSATLTESIDIFDRVNSQGTKLTEAELALTHIVGKWPIARRELKDKMAQCGERNFNFGLTFMTRALTTTVTRRALFETVHDVPKEQLEDGWAQLKNILDYLVTFLPQRAHIHSTDDLNTTNALIPLVAYLSRQGGKFPNDLSISHAVNWLYAALIWSRFTGQTDQRLEADVSIVAKEEVPWDALRSQIIDQRGRIEVKTSDLEGRGTPHPLYKATFILSKANGAIDWFNGLPLSQTHGERYVIHSHHIFPQSLLYKNGWDSDNLMDRATVNEIANRAFLTAETNLRISNTEPAEYLPQVADKYPGALVKQFIPMDPELWRLENYRDFLEARRQNIARKLNDMMNSLIVEPEETHRRPIQELIKLGESYVLEFKSTLQWDMVRSQHAKHLRKATLKTIAGFMNSEGGTLVIGVEDDGSPCGLDRDLKLVKGSQDGFEQLLVSLIAEHIGAAYSPYYRFRFEEVEGKVVCVLDVDRSREPVFLNWENKVEFYARAGNTTRPYDTEEALQYIELHWE